MYEELDAPSEFFYDRGSRTLYVVSNASDADAPPEGQFVAVPAANHTLLRVRGSQAQPVVNLTLIGLGLRDTAWTTLHRMP